MTGSLQVKNGKYYAVLNLKDAYGKRKPKWIGTDIEVKGNNVRKANQALADILKEYESKVICTGKDAFFCDYVEHWLENQRALVNTDDGVDEITLQGYEQYAEKHIIPYFKLHHLKVTEITSNILEDYRNTKIKNGRLDGKGGLSANSVKLHFVVIHLSLKQAVKEKIILIDPSLDVKTPKSNDFKGNFYSAEEVQKLLKFSAGEALRPLIMFSVYYGLRRSEALGLKWNAVDFENNTIEIKFTVVKCTEKIEKPRTKNQTSHRTYPLIPEFREALLELRRNQALNRLRCGKSYIKSDYVFVWDDGKPFDPDYVSHRFSKILKKSNLRHIRFHDLRHSCASVLLSKGVTLKDVQEWLGHANIKMTANVYGHLDMARKNSLAESLSQSIMIG